MRCIWERSRWRASAAIVALLIYEHCLVKAERSVARQRGLLHHERLCQRVILCILGR